MSELDVSFASLDADTGERFLGLRRLLGVSAFGLNLITLQPGQRGRVHAHERQEEVYIVLEGELALLVEGDERAVRRGEAVRVGAAVRRQLVNRGLARLVLLAIGGAGEHEGRDGRAWASWEEGGEGRPPAEVPLPEDVPTG